MTTRLIRNSTAEFLIFTRQAGEDGIEVRVAEGANRQGAKRRQGKTPVSVVWRSPAPWRLTAPALTSKVSIFDSGELEEVSVCRDFRHTADDGKTYATRFYNLDAIIAVGFRVSSARADRDLKIRGELPV